jgi:hypothetical protein
MHQIFNKAATKRVMFQKKCCANQPTKSPTTSASKAQRFGACGCFPTNCGEL